MSKPQCRLIGSDGNIFNLIGIAAKALTRNGQTKEADELTKRCLSADSYDQALQIILEYVDQEEPADECEYED